MLFVIRYLLNQLGHRLMNLFYHRWAYCINWCRLPLHFLLADLFTYGLPKLVNIEHRDEWQDISFYTYCHSVLVQHTAKTFCHLLLRMMYCQIFAAICGLLPPMGQQSSVESFSFLKVKYLSNLYNFWHLLSRQVLDRYASLLSVLCLTAIFPGEP